MAHDRAFYATLDNKELLRRYREAKDRETRADTTEAALADAFTIQEIGAVLYERQTKGN